MVSLNKLLESSFLYFLYHYAQQQQKAWLAGGSLGRKRTVQRILINLTAPRSLSLSAVKTEVVIAKADFDLF